MMVALERRNEAAFCSLQRNLTTSSDDHLQVGQGCHEGRGKDVMKHLACIGTSRIGVVANAASRN